MRGCLEDTLSSLVSKTRFLPNGVVREQSGEHDQVVGWVWISRVVGLHASFFDSATE